MSGEYLVSSACDECPYGSYSYEYTYGQGCLPCPAEASSCNGNQTDLKKGYWRESTYSTSILSCPYDTCQGGTGASDELCSPGSTGPLCAVCLEHYYYSYQDSKCTECVAVSYISPMLIAIFIIVGTGIVFGCYVCYVKYISPQALERQIHDGTNVDEHNNGIEMRSGDEPRQDNVITAASSGRPRQSKWYETFYAYMLIRFKDLAANFKIIVATLQILIAIPRNFLISFPQSYANFLSAFEILNLDPMNITRWKCVNNGIDYVNRLVVVTLVPFGLLGILFSCFVLHVSIYTSVCISHLQFIHTYIQIGIMHITYIRIYIYIGSYVHMLSIHRLHFN